MSCTGSRGDLCGHGERRTHCYQVCLGASVPCSNTRADPLGTTRFRARARSSWAYLVRGGNGISGGSCCLSVWSSSRIQGVCALEIVCGSLRLLRCPRRCVCAAIRCRALDEWRLAACVVIAHNRAVAVLEFRGRTHRPCCYQDRILLMGAPPGGGREGRPGGAARTMLSARLEGPRAECATLA
jgi:hypothetical protein